MTARSSPWPYGLLHVDRRATAGGLAGEIGTSKYGMRSGEEEVPPILHTSSLTGYMDGQAVSSALLCIPVAGRQRRTLTGPPSGKLKRVHPRRPAIDDGWGTELACCEQ